MKCEIINGKLFVKAGTVTEQWALDQFFDGIGSYQNPHNYIADASKVKVTPEQAAAVKAAEDAELDAVFGKIE